MQRNEHRSALDPPDHLIDRWSQSLKAGGGTGSLEEMEQQYLEVKGYDSWPEYFVHIGIDGHFNQQKLKFWCHFNKWCPEPPPLKYRLVHYLATTRLGVWYIQKYLGMKGRIAA